jgi:ClpP class serine protease
MALLGSIGVVVGVPDKKAEEERTGRRSFEFVSSQSPGKRPDPNTEDGRERVQKMVDEVAAVLIATVARNRSVSAEAVMKRFGAGGMLVGRACVTAGMADSVGQLEAAITGMIGSRSHSTSRTRASAPLAPAIAAPAPPAMTEPSDAARIKAVLQSEHGKEMPELASVLALDLNLPLATCQAVLAAGRRPYEEARVEAAVPKLDWIEMKRRAGALVYDSTSGSTNSDLPADRAGWSSAVAGVNAARPTR